MNAQFSEPHRNGLVSVASRFSFEETRDRLNAAIVERGLSVLARVDHAANAAAVGLSLRPTEVLLFGNPKGGTLLMQERQESGIDLPLKALIWQDASGTVNVTYNDPTWLAQRHGLGEATLATIEAMKSMLVAIAQSISG